MAKTKTATTTARKTAKTARKATKKAGEKAGKDARREPRYSHLTRLRCRRCGSLMQADGTTDGGRVKRWKCPSPVCRRTAQTVGEMIAEG